MRTADVRICEWYNRQNVLGLGYVCINMCIFTNCTFGNIKISGLDVDYIWSVCVLPANKPICVSDKQFIYCMQLLRSATIKVELLLFRLSRLEWPPRISQETRHRLLMF